jgi:uncharacterized protein YchJ
MHDYDNTLRREKIEERSAAFIKTRGRWIFIFATRSPQRIGGFCGNYYIDE